MKVKMIVAHDINLGIGFKNKLVWNIPEDLQHFKNETMNKIIVMGSKTYRSIGKPLPSRVNAVLSKNQYFQLNLPNVRDVILNGMPRMVDGELTYPEVLKDRVLNSVEEVLEYYKDEGEIYIIGGDSIYQQFLEHTDEIIATVVMDMYKVDTYFPFYIDKFKEVSKTDLMVSKTGVEYFIARYVREKK